jgi:class 3 adenylate cyclase
MQGKLADAATIHVYFPHYQNYNDTQMLADPLSFEHFIGRAFTVAFDNAEYLAQAAPAHLRIWVTEAGVEGSAQRWVDALTLMAFDALLALDNRTDLVLPCECDSHRHILSSC